MTPTKATVSATAGILRRAARIRFTIDYHVDDPADLA
jgi:hypothetical protein